MPFVSQNIQEVIDDIAKSIINKIDELMLENKEIDSLLEVLTEEYKPTIYCDIWSSIILKIMFNPHSSYISRKMFITILLKKNISEPERF